VPVGERLQEVHLGFQDVVVLVEVLYDRVEFVLFHGCDF